MCDQVSNVMDRLVSPFAMITNSMKRIVLSIIESSRDLIDARRKKPGPRRNVELDRALNRLEQAVNRLDRIEHARTKVD